MDVALAQEFARQEQLPCRMMEKPAVMKEHALTAVPVLEPARLAQSARTKIEMKKPGIPGFFVAFLCI